MGLTTFQQVVLKYMQKMTPAQQSAVARFAAALAKQRRRKKTNAKKRAKQAVTNSAKRSKKKHTASRKSPTNSGTTKKTPQADSGPRQLGLPPQPQRAKFDARDIEWLFSENRRREPVPRGREPLGQKWATNKWNHSGF